MSILLLHIVPKVGARISATKGIEVIPVSTLREAIGVGLVGKKAEPIERTVDKK